jgi:hypothetical protein
LAAFPSAPRLFIRVPAQSTCRHNLLHILAGNAADDPEFLGQLALQPTLVGVAEVTQTSDDCQPPQLGAQLSD